MAARNKTGPRVEPFSEGLFPKGMLMHSRRPLLRLLVVAFIIAASAVYLLTKEPVRGIDLHSRLLKSESLPAEMMESCTWDVAKAEYQRAGGGGTASAPAPAMGDPVVAQRLPARTIRDPYAGFAAVRVDPVHNEVVLMDEFKFNIYVYDRLAQTPTDAMQTPTKRFIEIGRAHV